MGRDKVILDSRLIEGYVTQDYSALAPETPLAEAKSRLLASHRHEGYVIDARGVYLGTVRLEEILTREQVDPARAVTVAQVATREPVVFTAKTSIWAAMEQMGDFVGESIPVLEDADDERMRGVVFEASVVKAYLDTMYDLRREENAAA